MKRFNPFAMALAPLLLVAMPLMAQTLIPSPPLAPGVAALPRLAGDGTTAGYINAALEDLDRRNLALVTCDGGTSDPAFRSVDTLSDGPAFLTFFITLGGFCDSAAHPSARHQLVTFDLASGLETQLLDLLPVAWTEPREAASQLFALYSKNLAAPLTDECLAAFSDTLAAGHLSFDLGPEKRSQKLVLLPLGLPAAHAACASEARVPLDQLQAARFDPRLIMALSGSPGTPAATH